MTAPLIARVLGIGFLLAGVAGFVPFLAPQAPPDANVITLDSGYRFIFAIFPVNVAHDAIHGVFGIWGLLASLRFRSSVAFCRAVAWIYGALIVLGIVPITNTLFGFAPIFGWDVALHFVLFALALYGGYGRGRLQPDVEN